VGAPSPAVAPPPGQPRFALFDSLRGLAAVAIITFHVASVTGALDRRYVGDLIAVLGPRSLTLFFVISGFLLYRPYAAAHADGRPGPRTARYARRRVLRIVPAYWLALTVLALFPGIAGVFTGAWWRYYFFLQLYSHGTLGTGIPVAWSLCVEVTYYALLPLWAFAVARVGAGGSAWLRTELWALALVAAFGIAIQLAGARQLVSELVAASLLGQCAWLALGMALAVMSVAAERGAADPRFVRVVRERPGLCWAGAGAALVGLAVVLKPGGLGGIVQALTTVQSVPRTLAGIVLTAAFTGLVTLPAVFGEHDRGLPRRLLRAAPVAWLGLVSYGLFLWHLPVVELLALPADPGHFSASGLNLVGHIHRFSTIVLLLLSLAVSATLAAASYYLVELPFLRRKEA
jgi:peptidoglycan/LPS O-acetylase OafA/YrhL